MSTRFCINAVVVSLVLLLAGSQASGQTVWYVNAASPCPGSGTQADPFCTIQAAINAAAANATPPDEIHVADGIYTGTGNKNLDFGGKKIKLIGVNGPANCIIDCQGSGRGLYLHSGEPAGSALEGITIRNGLANDSSTGGAKGGGVYCSSSSRLTLTNCIIIANAASSSAGSPGALGGGAYCMGPSTTFVRCTIADNAASCSNLGSATTAGGGVYCATSTTFTGCAICGNFASSNATSATAGSASAHGGGVYGGSSFTNCVIDGNGAYAYVNASATQGTATIGGGGIHSTSANGCSITNCTLVHNSAWPEGPQTVWAGGEAIGVSYPSTLVNSILYSNGVPVYAGSLSITYSYCENGCSGTGNIGMPTEPTPQLVDDNGPDNKSYTWADNDLHLQSTSPCIDAGDPTFLPLPDNIDLDGHFRVWDGDGNGAARVDMGAYEYGAFAYGDANCSGVEDGVDIQAFVTALLSPSGYAAAYPGCNVLVADLNGDQAVDLADVTMFVNLLIGE